jgi:hypothetical protein
MPAVPCVSFQTLSLAAVPGAPQNLNGNTRQLCLGNSASISRIRKQDDFTEFKPYRKENEPLRELGVARLYWKSRKAHVDLFDAVKNTANRPFIDSRVRRRNLQDASDKWRWKE